VIGADHALLALDEWLKHRGSTFRVPVLAAAIGIYLPLELMVPIFLGSLLSYFVEKKHGIVNADDKTKEHAHRPGTLFSAGLITGEALTGILIAIPIVVSGRADVLAVPPPWHFGQIVGLAVLCVVGYLLYRSGAKPKM
jgi:uncharacterized oligopeptide transporter (OPT) family protein